MPVRSRAGKASIIAVAASLITSSFFIDFCNLVYRCGCKSLWNGAAEACNIHLSRTHHCPWCSIGDGGASGIWLAVVLVQCVLAFRLQQLPWIPHILVTLSAFPIVGGLLAIAIGLSLNYWA